MSLVEIYKERYAGTEKTAKPDFAPGVKAKGLKALSKKNPALAAAAAETGDKGVKKASAEAIEEFKMGKIAGAAFMDELKKLNEADAMLLKEGRWASIVSHGKADLKKIVRDHGKSMLLGGAVGGAVSGAGVIGYSAGKAREKKDLMGKYKEHVQGRREKAKKTWESLTPKEREAVRRARAKVYEIVRASEKRPKGK